MSDNRRGCDECGFDCNLYYCLECGDLRGDCCCGDYDDLPGERRYGCQEHYITPLLRKFCEDNDLSYDPIENRYNMNDNRRDAYDILEEFAEENGFLLSDYASLIEDIATSNRYPDRCSRCNGGLTTDSVVCDWKDGHCYEYLCAYCDNARKEITERIEEIESDDEYEDDGSERALNRRLALALNKDEIAAIQEWFPLRFSDIEKLIILR